MSAISGLDIALWDLKGRRLNVPIWSLLGGKVREKMQVYVSNFIRWQHHLLILLMKSWIGGDRPNDIEKAAKARKDAGYKAVKVCRYIFQSSNPNDPFDKMNATEDLGWLDSPVALDAAVERLRIVKSLGLDAGIYSDFVNHK
jgi:galactonate dehydratase